MTEKSRRGTQSGWTMVREDRRSPERGRFDERRSGTSVIVAISPSDNLNERTTWFCWEVIRTIPKFSIWLNDQVRTCYERDGIVNQIGFNGFRVMLTNDFL
jgi:hypothetical protein